MLFQEGGGGCPFKEVTPEWSCAMKTSVREIHIIQRAGLQYQIIPDEDTTVSKRWAVKVQFERDLYSFTHNQSCE